MPTVRRTLTDIDQTRVIKELRSGPEPTEAQIEQWASEDGDAWTDEDIARAVRVLPRLTSEDVRRIQARLGLDASQFALKFGFGLDEIAEYEAGRRAPSGVASTLLRAIEAYPDAVARVVQPQPRSGTKPRRQRGG
jgi:DNA-binding transcriptional regulator YiaG